MAAKARKQGRRQETSGQMTPSFRRKPAYRDAGGRAASGTSRRGSSNSPPLEGCPPGRGGERMAGFTGCPRPVVTYCHSRPAGMACINHWIPAFAGTTNLYMLPARQRGQAKQGVQRYFSRIPSTRASISAWAVRIRNGSPACRSLASRTIRPPCFSVTIA